MRRHCLGTLLTAASLAGCAGTSPPTVSPQSLRALNRPTLSRGVTHVFLSDAVLDVVTIFDRNGKTRTLQGFNEPQGIATDSHGTLYVANTEDANVEEFAPPYRAKPTGVIATPGEFPVDVAIARSGTVAVVDICAGSGSRCTGSGNVYFYAGEHSKSPCATVSGGTKITRLLWAAFDAAGTLYVAGLENYTTAEIGEIPGGCDAATLTVLEPSTGIAFAAGVQVDPSGHIAVIDSQGFSGAAAIDVFAAPKRGSHKLELLSANSLQDTGVVSSFALTKDGAFLYTAEPHYSLEYQYPSGGSSVDKLVPPPSGGNLIEGVAVTP